MNLSIDIEVASEGDDVPDPDSITGWLQAAACNRSVKEKCRSPIQPSTADQATELSVRIVTRNEIQQLNATYRDKNYPTNVLSFPSDLPPNIPINHLGDIVICASVVNEEASQQNKSPEAHWAHMTTHGLLHLYGYDHETDDEAEQMESVETNILIGLGFSAPYEEAEIPQTNL